MPYYTPFFIVGFPRSGTTLMRALLGSHPEVAFFKLELPVDRLLKQYEGLDYSTEDRRRQVVGQILESASFRQIDERLDEERIVGSLTGNKPVDFSVVLNAIMDEYARCRERVIWGIKCPLLELSIDIVMEHFRSAAVIHMIRDPRDVAVSLKAAVEEGGIELSVPPPREWRRSLRAAQAHVSRYGRRYHAVRYEDLVAHPREITKSICKALSLSYSPQMLQLDGHPGYRSANSPFADIREASSRISTLAVSRWRDCLSVAEVHFYERAGKQEMLEWGYVIQEPKLSGKERLLYAGLALAEHSEVWLDAALWRAHARLPAAHLRILRSLVSRLALSTRATGWAIRRQW